MNNGASIRSVVGGVTVWAATRAPELDSMCDAPSVRPAWRVTRDGVVICIAETANESAAIAFGMRELHIRAARGAA